MKKLSFDLYRVWLISIALTASCLSSSAQEKMIRNLSVGWRSFEMDMPGSNPLSIAPLLQQPVGYIDLLSRFPYNGLTGNPSSPWMQHVYLDVEWRGKDADNRFWKKHGLITGLYITENMQRSTGSLSVRTEQVAPVFMVTEVAWSFRQQMRFAGVHAGLIRRFSVARRIDLCASFDAQAGWALNHRYAQRTDSTILRPGQMPVVHGKSLPDLAGKHYFQWHFMIPLALEVDLYKKQFFLRLEFIAGMLGGPMRQKILYGNEAHGFGISLIRRTGS